MCVHEYINKYISKYIKYIYVYRWVCQADAVRSVSLVGSLCQLRVQTAALSVSVQDLADTVRSREDSTEYL